MQIQSLMSISQLGLAPYRATTNFLLNIPNKPIEYLSRGLPILSTIDGALGDIISRYRVGVVCADCEPKTIADALERLHRDPDVVKKMRSSCERLFEEKYRADVVYSEFGDYLVMMAGRTAIPGNH